MRIDLIVVDGVGRGDGKPFVSVCSRMLWFFFHSFYSLKYSKKRCESIWNVMLRKMFGWKKTTTKKHLKDHGKGQHNTNWTHGKQYEWVFCTNHLANTLKSMLMQCALWVYFFPHNFNDRTFNCHSFYLT